MGKIGKKCVVFLASGCRTGFIPGAPGTFGTLAAIPLCYLVSRLSVVMGLIFIGFFTGMAVWASSKAEKIFSQKDSSHIVVDEMAGFLVALFLIPWGLKSVVIGFTAFRAFDIFKPFPIRRLESRWRGGWGVVGDDILAGIYANAVTRGIVSFL